jgi:hypothetical protein
MNSAFIHARVLAVTLLNLQPLRTPEVIRAQVQLAIQTTRSGGKGEVDAEALIAQLMHEASVHVPDATMMEDPTDHIEWLSANRGSIEWRFWTRYKTFLEQEKQFPEPAVNSLSKLTDEILSRLEQPGRTPPWDCRGMVVGSVQSGKTANYCGLICKAIDAGYRLVIVLAGMHNNLRSQTQYRIDEGVLGRDSQKDRQQDRASSLLGVGKLFGQLLPIHSLTSSLEDGDFRAPQADTNVTIGGDPVILVIKKNGSVLRNLLRWVIHVRGEDLPGENRKIVRGVPLLVIDDEADNASINTRDRKGKPVNDCDVTAINGRIRELLDAFERSAYVGYTATPFANIFINPDAETRRHGEDLFPRSFILNVSPPSNYVSPSRVFGLDGDSDAGIESRQELPLVRPVSDHESVFPSKHKKDLHIDRMPESLKLALYSFILVCAARRARGQAGVHNSMLVHVTRFIDVQHQVADQIQGLVESIRRRLQMGEGDRQHTMASELKRIWHDDFEPTSESIRGALPDENLIPVSWNEVAAQLGEAVARIEVKKINGHATDALDYVSHRQGFNVVAVGGDKLSRGLTLEGLSVSYFLRASQMYDTLMQMGRWFGYRPGYLDLCRLFTTDDLRRWYRHIALAEVELRREFDRMKNAGLTPRRYGLRIRQHPGGLLVTAMNKMSHSRMQRLSYAGQLVQTAHFSTSPEVVRGNKQAVERFLNSLGGRKMVSGALLWRGVSAAQIINDLLPAYSVASEAWRFQKPEMIEFIRRQAASGELTTWTVALVDTRGDGGMFSLANCSVGKAERSPESGSWLIGEVPACYRTGNANIQSPSHQAIDLAEIVLDQPLLDHLLAKRTDADGERLFDAEESDILRACLAEGVTLCEAAKRLTIHRKAPSDGIRVASINGEVARNLRPATHGLLLIYPVVPTGNRWPAGRDPFMGLAFSFPCSHTARAVEYRVNRVWQDTFQDTDYADGDE